MEQLYACGLLDESQNESLLHDIMEQFYLLHKHSMNWKPRGLLEFVSTIPIFTHASKVRILPMIQAMFTTLNIMLHNNDVDFMKIGCIYSGHTILVSPKFIEEVTYVGWPQCRSHPS